ncbi:MAG: hypothetical protein HY049_13605 [Acidobacteria bacterium]|nr:hypothetical protein [Acidobacteriota bacterium]
MARAIEPVRGRSRLVELAMVAAAAAAFLYVLRGASSGLYGYDPYFHIRYAQVLRTEGFSRTFPWWQETFLRDRYADKDFLYHVLLIPFTFGDLIAGARAAAACFGGVAVAVFYAVCRTLRVPWPALFTAALLASSLDFLYRLDAMRPVTLAVGLAMAGTCAILTRRERWAFAIAAIYPHAHISFHLLPGVALLHDVSAGRDASGRRSLRLTLYTSAGAAAGALFSPFFPNNLKLWWVQNVRVLDLAWSRVPELRLGVELEPRTSADLLTNGLGVFAALFLAICLMSFGRRRASAEARTLLLVSSVFLAMAMMSERFIEFLAPFALLLAAVAVRDAARREPDGADSAAPFSRRGRAYASAVTVALVLLVGLNARRASRIIARDPGPIYADASEWMRANVPAGETIFHLDWDDFPQLFYFNPQFRYLVGLDPVFMYATDPARWRLWSDIAHDDVQDLYSPIRETFRARWVFAIPEAEDFLTAARRDPRFFQRYVDPHAAVFFLADGFSFVTRWRVTGWYPDPARRLFDAALDGEPASAARAPAAGGGGSASTGVVEEDIIVPEGPAAAGLERQFEEGFVNLDEAMSLPPTVHDACGVAVATLRSPSRQTATLAITTDDEFRVYVDGRELDAQSPFRSPPPGAPGGPPATLDDSLEARSHVPERSVAAPLVQGENTILVKTCRVGADFGFFLRVYGTDGAPVDADEPARK